MDTLNAALEIGRYLLTWPSVRGALVGVGTAAVVDYGAFRSWKSWDDAMTYEWRTAAWRWFQGSVIGALTGLGLGWAA